MARATPFRNVALMTKRSALISVDPLGRRSHSYTAMLHRRSGCMTFRTKKGAAYGLAVQVVSNLIQGFASLSLPKEPVSIEQHVVLFLSKEL